MKRIEEKQIWCERLWIAKRDFEMHFYKNYFELRDEEIGNLNIMLKVFNYHPSTMNGKSQSRQLYEKLKYTEMHWLPF